MSSEDIKTWPMIARHFVEQVGCYNQQGMDEIARRAFGLFIQTFDLYICFL